MASKLRGYGGLIGDGSLGGTTDGSDCVEEVRTYYKRRIAELEQQLNEAKAGWDSAIADLYAAAEIAKGMQSQLDALTWTEITPRNLPRRGMVDEVLHKCGYTGTLGERYDPHTYDELRTLGWRYSRPINPPPRALEPQ